MNILVLLYANLQQLNHVNHTHIPTSPPIGLKSQRPVVYHDADIDLQSSNGLFYLWPNVLEKFLSVSVQITRSCNPIHKTPPPCISILFTPLIPPCVYIYCIIQTPRDKTSLNVQAKAILHFVQPLFLFVKEHIRMSAQFVKPAFDDQTRIVLDYLTPILI